jgi:hypothetical protein
MSFRAEVMEPNVIVVLLLLSVNIGLVDVYHLGMSICAIVMEPNIISTIVQLTSNGKLLTLTPKTILEWKGSVVINGLA